MSPSRVITASLPGRSSPASEAMSRSTLCIQSNLGEREASMWIVGRQELDQVAGSRVREAHGAADQAGRGAAPAVAEDLVSIAHGLTLEVENAGRWSSGSLRRTWPSPCGTSARSPSWIHRVLLAVGLEPHPARGDHVEPEVPRHRRQREAPGSGQLGAAVVGAVHPQEVQCLGEGIGRRKGSGASMAPVCLIMAGTSSCVDDGAYTRSVES